MKNINTKYIHVSQVVWQGTHTVHVEEVQLASDLGFKGELQVHLPPLNVALV